MYYVGVLESKNDVKRILKWGWDNKIEILSWPSFYSKVKLNKNLLNRWHRYICIPLNQNINKNILREI